MSCVPSNTDEMCVGEGEPLLEERCHGVTERWQSRKKATPKTAEPPAPLKGALRDIGVPSYTNEWEERRIVL